MAAPTPLIVILLTQTQQPRQVKTYACIYTSKASNLGLVSPERWFRTVRDYLPHDYLLGV